MAALIVNPKPFVKELTGEAVIVKLKWCMEYKGGFIGGGVCIGLDFSSLVEREREREVHKLIAVEVRRFHLTVCTRQRMATI